ncbi:MAG: dTMP kinase [bacterium]|nr:dTMP kinase [bacterium]
MKEKISKSAFIVFEGGEGSGKTTVINFIAKELKKTGYDVLTTHEPGGTRIGEKIREILVNKKNVDIVPRAELLLFLASRAQHMEEIIKPALAAQKVVICDRFSGSSFAYQYFGRQIARFEEIYRLDSFARDNLRPGRTILLDINPEIGLSERGKNSTRFEKEKLEFHQRVRAGYLELAKRNPETWRVIDASKPLKEVEAEALKIIKEFLETEE